MKESPRKKLIKRQPVPVKKQQRKPTIEELDADSAYLAKQIEATNKKIEARRPNPQIIFDLTAQPDQLTGISKSILNARSRMI